MQKHWFERVLKDEKVWDHYSFMFDECDFKIYKDMKVFYFKRELYEKAEALTKWRLEVSVSSLYKLLLTLLLGLGDLWLAPCLILLTEECSGVTVTTSKRLAFCKVDYLFEQGYRAYSKGWGERTTEGNSRRPLTVGGGNGLAATSGWGYRVSIEGAEGGYKGQGMGGAGRVRAEKAKKVAAARAAAARANSLNSLSTILYIAA